MAVAAVEIGIAEIRRRNGSARCGLPLSAGDEQVEQNRTSTLFFSFISSNWRGEPLRDYETVVKLIAKTTTAKGLTVTCRLDRRKYPSGRKVTPEEMKRVNLHPDPFHGEWNYVIRPH